MTKKSVGDGLTFALTRSDHQIKTMFYDYGFTKVPLEEANFIVFPGGADINPFLYGEHRRRETMVNMEDDLIDIKAFKNARPDQYLIGICRGGQFLNTMCGGRMYQHVTNHAIHGLHPIYNLQNDKVDPIMVTSTHHQMMRPGHMGKVLYASNLAIHRYTDETHEDYSENGRLSQVDDAEIVLYPDHNNTLCFQPHPEYNTEGNDGCRSLFFDLIEEYCLSEQESVEMYARYNKKLEKKPGVGVSMYGRQG